MAYQPNSYKKFVATAATATLVATAVVPAAFADEVKPAAFTDVAKQYEAAVNFVVSNNIAKGLSETQFGVSAQIKRGDAAIMIANAAGLNDEKAPQSGFSDVPTRGVLAINSLKAAGVVNGKSATNFGFNDSITRGEAAIMFANAFKLTGDAKDMKFTDVSDRYKDAVAALVKEGVTNGISATQFGTANNIKRGDFARFVYALEEYVKTPDATNPEAPVLNYDGASTLNVEYGAAFSIPTVTATDNIDTSVEVTNVIKNAAGNTVNVIDTKVPGTYTVTYSAVDSEGNKAKDLVLTVVVAPEVVSTPAVSSVVAVDAATVQINFNTPLDKATFNAASNFSITQGASTTDIITGQSISEDGKTVTLTVSPVMVNGNQYTVTVDNELQTAAGEDFAKVDYVQNILFNDKVAPTVSAVSTPNGNLRITMSEKVQVSPQGIAIVVNGQSVGPITIDGNVLEVSAKNLQDIAKISSGNSYQIAVAGARDLAGNDMTLYASTFTYQTITDTVAPTFTSVTAEGETTLSLKFSEELIAETAADLGLVIKQNGATIPNTSVTVETTDNVNYTVTLPTTIYTSGSNSASLEVTTAGYRDQGRNIGASSTKSVTVNRDLVKPTFVRSTVDNVTNSGTTTATATFTFSEDVVRGTGAIRVINNSNSVEVPSANYAVSTSNNQVVIAGLTPGSYTVYFADGAVRDTAITPNANAAFNTTISSSASSATVNTAVANGDVLTVTYSTPVTGGTGATSAANVANYRLDGQPLPAGTVITLSGAVATISLPEGSIASSRTGILTVNNVAATNGAVVNNTNTLVQLTDTRSPELTAVKVVGTTLEMTFSESIRDTTFTDATPDFAVRVNGIVINGTVATGTTANDNKLVFTPSTDASVAAGSVTVEVLDGANGADLAGNVIVTGGTVAATR